MRARRRALSESFQNQASLQILRQFERLRLRPKSVGLYYPIQSEISPLEIFHHLKERGIPLYFPRCQNGKMDFFKVVNLEELEKTDFGPAPASTQSVWNPGPEDLLLVPGVAFSFFGARLGFGRAFFDRYLSEFSSVCRLALAYDFQILPPMWLEEPQDAAMHGILSPNSFWLLRPHQDIFQKV